MKKIKDGGPAFSAAAFDQNDNVLEWQSGMSLRDYFAAKAMQGLMGRAWNVDMPAQEIFDMWAVSAYAVADAMLKQRETGNGS